MLDQDMIDVRNGKTTFADMAYRWILNGLLTHRLKPGDSLRSRDLAAVMGISPTPIERALERLAGEGLVEFRPGRGPYVPKLSMEEIIFLYEARLMIESFAVQEGIRRVDDAFLASFQTLIEVHQQAVAAMDGTDESSRRVAECDRELHLHIVSLWQNPKAQAWYRQINVHTKSVQLTTIAGFYREGSVEEHRDIYQALKNQDATAAAEAVRRHLMSAKDWFIARAKRSLSEPAATPPSTE